MSFVCPEAISCPDYVLSDSALKIKKIKVSAHINFLLFFYFNYPSFIDIKYVIHIFMPSNVKHYKILSLAYLV